MCDFYSWIEKDGELFYLDDKTIEAKWPNDDVRDHIGHTAIESAFPESVGGQHCENAIDIPPQIAKEINRGHMAKMAKAGGWNGARYTSRGHLCSPWWKNVEQFIEAIKNIKWMDNHEEIKKEWKIFETRASAYDSACDSALYASCLISDPGLPHSKQVTDRLDVWLRGYGLLCDVNGVLYVYKKTN
jgi:hypothetical protein